MRADLLCKTPVRYAVAIGRYQIIDASTDHECLISDLCLVHTLEVEDCHTFMLTSFTQTVVTTLFLISRLWLLGFKSVLPLPCFPCRWVLFPIAAASIHIRHVYRDTHLLYEVSLPFVLPDPLAGPQSNYSLTVVVNLEVSWHLLYR